MNSIYDCRLLIVDDYLEIRRMVTGILKQRGFSCLDTAASCREAGEKVRSFRPDLIILDVMLPDGDGFSFMKDCGNGLTCRCSFSPQRMKTPTG